VIRPVDYLPRWGLKMNSSINLDVIVSFATYLGEAARWVEHASGEMGPDGVAHIQREIGPYKSGLSEIGLTSCVDQIERLEQKLTDEKVTFESIRVEMRALTQRLSDEFSHCMGIMLTGEHIKWFSTKEPLFGERVADRFPRSTRDIEEAGKCLALNRATACVFHLMRVMEVGLRSVASGLGIPYAPSWESYIAQIQTKIDEKHSKKGRKWQRQEPFFRDVLAHLHAIKIAWRNPTMHIVNHYTPEQGQEVFNAVRGFMRHLAEGLPEPKKRLAKKEANP
jgi:hypothetical protein